MFLIPSKKKNKRFQYSHFPGFNLSRHPRIQVGDVILRSQTLWDEVVVSPWHFHVWGNSANYQHMGGSGGSMRDLWTQRNPILLSIQTCSDNNQRQNVQLVCSSTYKLFQHAHSHTFFTETGPNWTFGMSCDCRPSSTSKLLIKALQERFCLS